MWSSNGPNTLHNCFQFKKIQIVFGINVSFLLFLFFFWLLLCFRGNKLPWIFLIHLHLAPKNIALRMAVCLPCQKCFIWFPFRENPHAAKFKPTSMPQRCLQISELCFKIPSECKWSSKETYERKGNGECMRRRCRNQKNKHKEIQDFYENIHIFWGLTFKLHLNYV